MLLKEVGDAATREVLLSLSKVLLRVPPVQGRNLRFVLEEAHSESPRGRFSGTSWAYTET
jgi:hypothetical protein